MMAKTIDQFEQQILSGEDYLTGMAEGRPLQSVAERRGAWLNERYGKFTASGFYRVMWYYKKSLDKLPAGAVTYAMEKAAERLSDRDDSDDGYTSRDMQWGIDHEVEAVNLFTERTGFGVDFVGDKQRYIALNDDIGGTPDGIIQHHDQFGGVEMKCPASSTHIKYMMSICDPQTLKDYESKYYWQVQGQMMITNSTRWWFCSYDPRFNREDNRLLAVEITRNESDIEALETRLKMVVELRNDIVNKMAGKQ